MMVSQKSSLDAGLECLESLPLGRILLQLPILSDHRDPSLKGAMKLFLGIQEGGSFVFWCNPNYQMEYPLRLQKNL